MVGAAEEHSDQDHRAKRASASAVTRREVGLAPETGAKAPDLVEVEGFTKEVIGVVMKEAVEEAALVVSVVLTTIR